MRALLAFACILVCVGADAAPAARSGAGTRPEAYAPADVQVEVANGESGRWNVRVRRHGHLVVLRAGEQTSAARDSVAAEIDGPTQSAFELAWETTDPSTLETNRGGIRVSTGEDGPRVSSFALPPPAVAASHRDRLHECRAFEHDSKGFAVVCRVARSARKLSAVNLTGESPSSGVAMAAERESLVRLDLPVAEGGAEARLIGYLDGNKAVVVRAEAIWASGEDRPTLSLAGGTRDQLIAPRIRPWADFDFTF